MPAGHPNGGLEPGVHGRTVLEIKTWVPSANKSHLRSQGEVRLQMECRWKKE